MESLISKKRTSWRRGMSFEEAFGIERAKEIKKKMSKTRRAKKKKRLMKYGYVYILMPSHPNAMKSGYVLEHRLVMGRKLGRYLNKYEAVHHINGIRDDNRPENLKIVALGNHNGETTCPYCLKTFHIR